MEIEFTVLSVNQKRQRRCFKQKEYCEKSETYRRNQKHLDESALGKMPRQRIHLIGSIH